MATGALSPRANVGAFTAPGQAQARLASQAGQIAFDFGMAQKNAETRVYISPIKTLIKYSISLNNLIFTNYFTYKKL